MNIECISTNIIQMIKIFLIVTDKIKEEEVKRESKVKWICFGNKCASFQCNQIISEQTLVLKNGKFVISLLYWLVVFKYSSTLHTFARQRIFSIQSEWDSQFCLHNSHQNFSTLFPFIGIFTLSLALFICFSFSK